MNDKIIVKKGLVMQGATKLVKQSDLDCISILGLPCLFLENNDCVLSMEDKVALCELHSKRKVYNLK